MSLPDDVLDLQKRGILKSEFRVADIRKHLKNRYAENYLRTALANFAEETGNYVERWSDPRFRRVSRGLYKIV